MMNKTALKIVGLFVVVASLIAMILLCVNFLAFAVLGNDTKNLQSNAPQKVLEEISENIQKEYDRYYLSDESIVPDEYWCILLNENGEIIWQQNKPDDIPNKYSIQDIAKLTRWFLNHYPVYVKTEEYGLFILGMPKDAVGKYSIEYSMDWFDTLPQRILKIFVVNLCFACVIACIFGIKLYQKLKEFLNAIDNLKLEKKVHLKQKGLFRQLCQSINETSEAIQRKNKALALKENARLNWVSGISHDIRTPLSIVTVYGEFLSNCVELSEENRKKAETITLQSMKMKKLIADLNLISSLEYDMQPYQKKKVRLCPFIRHIVSDIINGGLAEQFNITLELRNEKALILADEFLLERALFNIINNSIVHNQNGCTIYISEYKKEERVFIEIRDNGSGVKQEVIKNIEKMPQSSHGFGLPMAYRIIKTHDGEFYCKNENGFVVTISFLLQ